MTDVPNPYATPAHTGDFLREPLPDVGSILVQGAKIMGGCWVLILAVLSVVWLPYELIVGYLEYEVFGEEFTFYFATSLADLVFTSIASAATIVIAMRVSEGVQPSAIAALGHSLRILIPFVVTMLMWTIPVALGMILLVIPGLILFTRLALTDSVVVSERVWGFKAMQRSIDLTSGSFWPLLGLCLLFIALSITPWFLFGMATIFFAQWDQWYVAAMFAFGMDIVEAYPVICWYLVYRRLRS